MTNFSPHVVRQGSPYRPPIQTVSADGAIAPVAGIAVITKGTAATLTLADPALADNGAILEIVSNTAAAHTVSNAAGSGFNVAGAAGDVGTFGAAIGNGLRLLAWGGNWLVLNNIGVTVA